MESKMLQIVIRDVMKCELALPQYPLLLSPRASLESFLSLILDSSSLLMFYSAPGQNYGDLHITG